MLNEPMGPNEPLTLAQRLSEGKLPVADALQYAMQLADSLRQLHEEGRAHGAVTPSNLTLTADGLELLPAPESASRATTPYTAPEVVQGGTPDSRSDVFGFGAVLFEMLTGRRAFEGQTRAALAEQLLHAPTPLTGNPAIDRLLGPCLHRNPDLRSPRLQKVQTELKLLSVAARRTPATAPGLLNGTLVETSVGKAELQQLEARLLARLQLHEQTVTEMYRSLSETVQSMRHQMDGLRSEMASSRQSAPAVGGLDDGQAASIQARVERGFEALNSRLAQTERTVAEMRRFDVQIEQNMAADLVDIEHTLKVQAAAIESARTAMAQTDDLVERVVEALEALQASVLDEGDSGPRDTLAHR